MVMANGDAFAAAAADDSLSGVIRFEVDNMSTLTSDGKFSPVVEVRGIPWRLWVFKELDSPFAKVYLYYGKSDSNIWSIDVSAEISLINNGGKGISHTKKFKKTFNCEIKNWGFPQYISWEDLINEEKGFIKNDKVTFEARFTLSNIMGIRIAPHFDFTDPNEPRHDVAFVINGEKIYANKAILSIHSPVMNAMFFGNFVEKNKEEIEMKDINREEFIALLNLIYPSGEKMTDASVENLLKLADRFQIKVIIDQAEQFLIDSNMSIASKLKLSDDYRLVKLQDHCLDNLKTNKDIKNLKTTNEYKSLSDKAKAMLLEKMMIVD